MAQLTQKPKARVSKSVAHLEDRLAQVEQQIRMVDVGYGIFSTVAVVLAYAFLVILLDRFFTLSSLARQVIFLGFLSFMGWWIYSRLWNPLTRKINPIFAAVMVERVIPESHNSVVNWVDLKNEKIPESVRAALGHRAEKDMGSHENEEVVSNRAVLVSGTLAGTGFFLLVLLVFIFGKSPFFSHLGRAFTPFVETTIASRNRVTILTPEGGNAVISMGAPVEILAKVEGRVPSEKSPGYPQLLLRYQENEDWHSFPMQAGEIRSEFKTKVLWSDVRSGFSYKVVAGDGESKAYQVDVRLTPLIADFQALYKLRPYMGKSDLVSTTRKIEAPEGTTVQIRLRANCKVREGLLRFQFADGVEEKIYLSTNSSDQTLLNGSFVLSQSGQYRVEFLSSDRDHYVDSIYHPVAAIKDLAPKVELTVPGKEVTIPLNGVLNLAGLATDDFGVRKLTLKLKAGETSTLAPIPYRNEKSLQLPSGGNPTSVQYSDFIESSTLREENGAPYKPVVGSFIDYWLETEDGCDFPKANQGKSKVYRVKFSEKQADDQAQKDKMTAQKQKEENEKKQEENNRKEDQQRQEEQKENEKKKQEGQKSEKKDGKDNPEKSNGKGGQGKGMDQSKADEKQENNNNDKNQGNDKSSAREKDGKGDGVGEGKDNNSKDNNSGDKGSKNKMDDSKFNEQEKRLNDAMKKNQEEKGEDSKGKQGPEKNQSSQTNEKSGMGEDKENNKASGNKEKGSDKESKGSEGKDAGKQGSDKGGKEKGAPGGNSNDKTGNNSKQGENKGKENGKGLMDKNDGKGDPNGKGQPEKTEGKGDPKGKDAMGKNAKGVNEKGTQDKAGMNKQSPEKGMEKEGPGTAKGNEKGSPNKAGQDKEGKAGNKESNQGDMKKGMEKNTGDSGTEKGNQGKEEKGNQGTGMEKGNTGKGGDEKGGKEKGDSTGGKDGKGEQKNSNSKNGMEKNGSSKDGKDGNDGKGGMNESKTTNGGKEKGMGKGNNSNDKSNDSGGKEKGEKGSGGMEKGNEKGSGQNPGMEKEGMGKSGMGKGPEKGAGPDSAKGNEKGVGGNDKKGAEGKGGAGKDGMGKADGMGKDGGNEKGNSMGKGADGKNSDGKEGTPKGGDGNDPGQGGKDRPPTDDPSKANPNAKKSPEAADEANKRKAIDAQIDNYKKRISPDVLKDAKMTPEDLERFLQDKKRRLEEKLGLDDSSTAGGGLGKGPGMGGKRFQSGTGKATDTPGSNQALPPPSYRDAYKEFTKKLAKPELK